MIKLITEIDLFDSKIKVYYHSDNGTNPTVSWQMRNPDSCYTGIMYMGNVTGKMSYPDDAIIPDQTMRDKEMLPKSIIIGVEELSEELKEYIVEHLKIEYNRRNKIKMI